MKPSVLALAVVLPVAILSGPAQGLASPILGEDLASFTVLGASTVTNVPTSAIVGNVGVWSSGGANAITGFLSSPGVGFDDPQVTDGQVHAGSTLAESAQGQLTTARADLAGLMVAPEFTFNQGAELGGFTLTPGIYSFASSALVTGTLTLNGMDDPNARWVFLIPTTLTTATDSVVNMINTGSGASLFWDVGSSATIGTNSTFLGNILALTSITMNTGATNACGRALADEAAVTLDSNSLSRTCTGILAGSNGLDGALAAAPVPEPSSLILFGSGLFGIAVWRKFKKNG
jgi:hypothetical protein